MRARGGAPGEPAYPPRASEGDPLTSSSPFAHAVHGEKPPTPFERVLWVGGPFAFLIAGYVLAGVVAGWGFANSLLTVGGLAFFGLGTSVILGPAAWGPDVLKDVSTGDATLVVMWMSAATAFLFSYNLDLLHKLPVVGPWLGRARKGAVEQLAGRPWIRRWAAAGVGFFVFLPLPASGTIGGAIMGRLLGLPRFPCFLAVALGSLLAASLYWIGGASLARWTQEHDVPAWARVAMVLGVLVLVGLLGRFAIRAAKRTK
jgi:hypothetical protein